MVAPSFAEGIDINVGVPNATLGWPLQPGKNVKKRGLTRSRRAGNHRNRTGPRRKSVDSEHDERGVSVIGERNANTFGKDSQSLSNSASTSRIRLTKPVSASFSKPVSSVPLTRIGRLNGTALIDSPVLTSTMSSGHWASVSQNGQTAIGMLVRTKKDASALSGGAMNPVISTA